jgi:hypothetical protein
MKKFLNKNLKTEKEIALGQEYELKANARQEVRDKLNDAYYTYYALEGKYAKGTKKDEWAGQGTRGYDYVYATEADKAKEKAEMETYYNEVVKPLKDLEAQLIAEMEELKEQLCFALYGYNLNKYYKFQEIARVEREIKKLEQELVEYNEYLVELRKEVI